MMDQSGAVFAWPKAEQLSVLRDFIFSKQTRFSDFENIVAREGRDCVLLRRYGSRDEVPNWMPRRSNPGDPLTFSESRLAELSNVCREIIGFFYVDNWVDYQHWKAGELVRFMDGSDEGWDTVSGGPEAWEGECFFPPGSMERRVAELNDYRELTPEREQAMKSAWATKMITDRALEPPVSIGNMLRCIEKHFGIWLRD